MRSKLKQIVTLSAVFVIVVFVLFVFNQTIQVVQTARTVGEKTAQTVLWGLISLYSILLIAPVFLWLRLPRRILPPSDHQSEEYKRFMKSFRRRLARNPRLNNIPLKTSAEVDSALKVLEKHADDTIASAASTVFLSTAVLQSGRLDVLVVLAAQTRLIWNVAHVYYHRPSLRDFVYLYANVASTAFIAAGIEDVDIDALIGTVFGSGMAAIPGMHLLAASILSGSANAFLTLRLGMIAKAYCQCTSRIEKRGIRRAATVQAAKLLSVVVKDGTVRLSRAALSSSKAKLNGAFQRIIRRRNAFEPGTD